MNDITHRLHELGAFCNGIIPNTLPLEPSPDDFRALADDLRLLAAKVDAVVEAYGEHFDANTPGYVAMSLFKNQLSGALDGNALYEIENAADVLAEEIMENA